jgi:hypothetical protein
MTGTYTQFMTLEEAIKESAKICMDFDHGLDTFLEHTHQNPIMCQNHADDGTISITDNLEPQQIKTLLSERLTNIQG